MQQTARPAATDPRRIAEYDDARHVPAVLARPLSAAELQPFIDAETLVTFTVPVPLEAVAHAADGSLSAYIEEHWLSKRQLQSPEYRAVGAGFDDFDEEYAGTVHLQVTGQLAEPR